MSARTTAGCGRPRTRDGSGRRSSTSSRRARSASSPSRRPLPTRSTSEAGRAFSGRISRWATGSTNRRTPGRRGRISASGTPSRSPASPFTRAIQTAFTRPCSATRTARTRSGACSAPRTAGRRGRKCSTRTRTRAPRPWRSIRAIRTSSTRFSGRRARVRGRTASGRGPRAGSSSRGTAGRRGRSSRRGSPRSPKGSGASGSASRRPTHGGYTRRWTRPKERPGSTCPTTRAKAGCARTARRVSGAAARTSPRCARTRGTGTKSGRETRRRTARRTAAGRSRRSRGRRAGTITTRSSSTPRTPT